MKEFEAWWLEHHGARAQYDLDKVTEGPYAGEYRDAKVQGYYNVWCAAITAQKELK